MNLYLISQRKNNGYDTYDSAVVAAESEDDARSIHPGGGPYSADQAYTWAAPEYVTAIFIGIASPGTERGVICASFNAG